MVEVSPAECQETAVEASVAAEIARRCDVEVEITGERTEYGTKFALPSGAVRLDTSIAAIRTRVTGQWAGLDRALVATDDGFEVVSPVTPMVFSDGRDGAPLARVERDGSWLIMDVPFDLPSPEVTSESQLTYFDVLPGVDLVVSVNDDATGFSEAFRIDSPEAAADPRLSSLALAVSTSGDLELTAAHGGFQAVKDSGERVFSSPRPLMWDSRLPEAGLEQAPVARSLTEQRRATEGVGLDARAQAPRGGERVAAMGLAVRGGAVTIRPDRALLDDPDTVWPVYLDPSVSGNRNQWISIRDDGWADYNYTGDQGVGRCGSTSAPMNCSKVFTRRAMWEFNGQGLVDVGNINPEDVISATFRVYGTHSYSCTPYPVELWRTGMFDSATRWPGAWVQPNEARTLAHKPSCGNAGWVEFNALEGARAVAAAGTANLALGLKAQDEGSSTGWKRYTGNDATLSVSIRDLGTPSIGTATTSRRGVLASLR